MSGNFSGDILCTAKRKKIKCPRSPDGHHFRGNKEMSEDELTFKIRVDPELRILAAVLGWDNWIPIIEYGLQEAFMDIFGGGEIDNSTIRNWIKVTEEKQK